MKNIFKLVRLILVLFSINFFLIGCDEVVQKKVNYKVTVTNLTHGQSFTPVIVASHTSLFSLFEAGMPAEGGLINLAEAGDVSVLFDQLSANENVVGVSNNEGLLLPGKSVSFIVSGDGVDKISLAAMLIPTNDAFMALNGVNVRHGKSSTHWVNAYDAGTEMNDEACANIPGPFCMGQGLSPDDEGEGFIHIHNGIHGVADLVEHDHTWHNPVARVSIVPVSVMEEESEELLDEVLEQDL